MAMKSHLITEDEKALIDEIEAYYGINARDMLDLLPSIWEVYAQGIDTHDFKQYLRILVEIKKNKHAFKKPLMS